jgi:hypothetical protein
MARASFNQLQLTAHGLAAAMGVASLVGAFAAFAKGLNPVMAVTLLALGVLLPWLAWGSLHKSRAAWSFLIATVSVFGAVTLFGSPKIRDLLDVDLGVAALIPFAQIGCVVMLSLLSDDYKDRTA